MENEGIPVYFRHLERLLDCPKNLRRPFLNQTRRMAEDYIQGNPGTTQRDLVDYLGEPQELAQGFLETLDPDVLERHRKRKKILSRACIVALVLALIGISVWGIYIKNVPQDVEVTETIIIYPEFTEGP